MGATSYLLAIGPFSRSIEKHLDYPSNWYENTSEGTKVTSSVFHAETSSSSRELAEFFGIEFSDPQTWYISNNSPKLASPQVLVLLSRDPNTLIKELDYPRYFTIEDIKSFQELYCAGFDFIFMPDT